MLAISLLPEIGLKVRAKAGCYVFRHDRTFKVGPMRE